jgi:hypothetical protein
VFAAVGSFGEAGAVAMDSLQSSATLVVEMFQQLLALVIIGGGVLLQSFRWVRWRALFSPRKRPTPPQVGVVIPRFDHKPDASPVGHTG